MPAAPPAYPPSIYEEVCKRLRTACPVFGNRVGGTSELSTAYRTVAAGDIAVPQAWVVPIFETDESDDLAIVQESHNFPQHKITEYFSIIVAVDNAEQGLIGGKSNFSLRAHAALEVVRAQVRRAIMGWRIKPRFTPCRFSRGDHLAMNGKYLWHVWEYRFEASIDPTLTDAELALVDTVAAKVNSMSDMIPYENSILPLLRTLHVGFGVGSTGGEATTRDYFDDEPLPTDPLQAAIDAAIAGADDTIEVNAALGIPAPEASPEEIGEKVFHAPHFDDYFMHGTEVVEVTEEPQEPIVAPFDS